MTSKLGFHIQRRRPGWPDVIADTVPALIKTLEWRLVDEWVAEEQRDLIKRERAKKWRKHNCFLLGRHVMTPQYLEEPQVRAGEFWDRLLGELCGGDASQVPHVLARMRCFDAWEGYNEIGVGPDIEKLACFDAHLAHYFHNEGIRYAAGGFSMTTPTTEDWSRYCRALLDQVDRGNGDLPDLTHFHEYWFPGDDWGELVDSNGQIDSERMRQATRGYMLHWRDLYAHEATPPRMRRPVIISECGWDQGWPRQVGYRRSTRSDADYIKWLAWYDRELQKPLDGIDYVVGAAIYTYGHEDRWASFELDKTQGRGILDGLRAYLRTANQEPHSLDWKAAWEIKPPAVEPVETHYVLLSEACPESWRAALGEYLSAFRATSGQSLHDALRLAGEPHHITLVGSALSRHGVPREWEDQIRTDQPGTLVDRLNALSLRDLQRLASRRVRADDRYGVQDEQAAPPRPRWLERRS
jgi:hypothetical protein